MTTLGPLLRLPASVPSRAERLRTPLTTVGGLALATLALHLRDPHQHASWGLCPSAMIGVSCPGCGGLRAVNDLTDGHVGAAFSSNFAFMVLLPFLVLGLGVWVVDAWRGTRTRLSPGATRVVGGGVLLFLAVFTVLRNLPVGAWLAP